MIISKETKRKHWLWIFPDTIMAILILNFFQTYSVLLGGEKKYQLTLLIQI